MEEVNGRVETKELSGESDSKVLYIVIGVLVLIVVCLSCAVGYLVLKEPERSDFERDDEVSDNDLGDLDVDPYEGWKTFESNSYLISLEYPASYKVKETFEIVGCEHVAAYVQNADPCPTGTTVSVPVIEIETDRIDSNGLPYKLTFHIAKSSGFGGACLSEMINSYEISIKGSILVHNMCVQDYGDMVSDPSGSDHISLPDNADYSESYLIIRAENETMMSVYLEILDTIKDI